MLVFDKFEIAPGVTLDAPVRRGLVHVLVLESDDAHDEFINRYLADISGSGEGGDILLEEVRDGAGRPRRLRDLPPATVRGYFARFVGFILRDGGLIDTLTVRENLLLPFRFAQVWPHPSAIDDAEIARRLAALLDFPGAPALASWLDLFPSQLSLAEQRMVGFLRTYVRQSELVIAFGPFSGLDAGARQRLWAAMQHYCMMQPTCAHVLVLHRREELQGLPGAEKVVELPLLAAAPISP